MMPECYGGEMVSIMKMLTKGRKGRGEQNFMVLEKYNNGDILMVIRMVS